MKLIALTLCTAGLAATLATCVAPSGGTAMAETAHPEARVFDPAINADAAVDAALERAAERGTNVLLVMGGNWCHDSRALAGWLETPRIADLVAERFELVYVNVGMPQTGDGHNLDIAARFGLDELPGTPNLLVIAPGGTLLNPDTATGWRNAASRSEDEIYEKLASFPRAAAFTAP